MRDVLEARDDVAGVFADGEAVEDEVGKAVGARERERERFALEDAVGGFVESAAMDAIRDLAFGHAQRVGGGDAVGEEDGKRLAEGEDGLRDEERTDEREAEEPGVARGAADFGLAPAPEGDGAEHEADGDEGAVVEGEVRDADEQAGRERKFAAEGSEERLKAWKEEEEEEQTDADGDEDHEHGIGEGGDELTAELALFVQVRDETREGVVERAGGFAGLDEIDGGGIEDGGKIGHRARERRAFAEAFPEFGAECAQGGFLDARGEEAHGFAGGHAAGDEIVERFEEGQALVAIERAGAAGRFGDGGRGGGSLGRFRGFARGDLGGGNDLEPAGGEEAQGVAATRGFECVGDVLPGAVAGGVGETGHVRNAVVRARCGESRQLR